MGIEIFCNHKSKKIDDVIDKASKKLACFTFFEMESSSSYFSFKKKLMIKIFLIVLLKEKYLNNYPPTS